LVGIAKYFDRIVSYEDVTHGKPAPDIFLLAARLANARPTECIVVEDSVTGTTAAVAAGIRSIGFTGTHAHPQDHAQDLLGIGADVSINHMRELIPLL